MEMPIPWISSILSPPSRPSPWLWPMWHSDLSNRVLRDQISHRIASHRIFKMSPAECSNCFFGLRYTIIFLYQTRWDGRMVSENCFFICIYCICVLWSLGFRTPYFSDYVCEHVPPLDWRFCHVLHIETRVRTWVCKLTVRSIFVQYLYDKFFGLSVAECKC